MVAAIALIWGLAYLFSRLIFTAAGANPALFAALFAAELIGWLALGLYVFSSLHRSRPLPPREGDASAVDILIPTATESAEVIEPTLIGAISVRGNAVAAEHLADAIVERYRVARGSLENLTGARSPIFGRGFPIRARLAYLSSLLFDLLPLQQLLYTSVIVAVLLSGALPLRVSVFFVCAMWIPQFVLMSLANWLVSSGSQPPLAMARNAWLAMGILPQALFDALLRRRSRLTEDVVAESTSSWRESIRSLTAPLIGVSVLTAAVALRLMSEWLPTSFLPGIEPIALATVLGFAVLDGVILAPMLVRLLLRRQYRSVWRVDAHLDALVGGITAEVEDLSETGARVRASHLIMDSILECGEVKVAIRTSTAKGSSIWAHGILVPTHINPVDFGEVELSGPILWRDERSRVAVVEHCYVVHPASEGVVA